MHRREGERAPSLGGITLSQAAAIGLFQSVAIIPGVSRSGATIVGGLALGISREAIVEFSFLLAVPILAGASALDFARHYSSFSPADGMALAAGFVTSFIVALVTIRSLLRYARRHTFIPFGIYRICAAIVFSYIIFA
jgi:undecaprenyl-diphosphatase